MGQNVKTDKDTIVKIIRMRIRDFRNGVENTLNLTHDKVVSQKAWTQIAIISKEMTALWETMMETNGLDGKINESVIIDMTELAIIAKDMTLTPSERKAKAAKLAELQKQIDAIEKQKAEL
ncbi:MAG: hypothetical protein CMC15_13940 [Flavobacteriaceae bacterium]|nr:hypothetical protein [Flavobacteriaceae bacterium]|tara:strand:+ start:984 stop:1346 length:363 start_codon:yes stop_codon:yes gene_type:complete